MGVSLKNIHLGEVQPMCDDCGIALCWSVDLKEFIEWFGFWDVWKCCRCNPDYKNAYQKYKEVNKPFKDFEQALEFLKSIK